MGSLTILNDIPALQAEDQLGLTQTALNSTLTALSSGARINTGADDPAGLAIANGLEANVTALTQSVQNATDGVGELQVADGALSQITALLNSAVSLATESANGTISDEQRTALQAEFSSIAAEIDSIGSNTTYNGQAIFSSTTVTIYMSDSTSAGVNLVSVAFGTVSSASLGVVGTSTISIASDNLGSSASAILAMTSLNNAIQGIAQLRGDLGADSNQLSSAINVMNVQITNLTNAENSIMAANMGEETSNLSKYSILQQTGIAALQESQQLQQNVLKLFQ
ncbi:MAG TPA: flagellin [Terriglobales bacterium]|nr:flagellin [Terriglobales bacterium]